MMTMSVDRVISVVLIIVVGVMLGRGITTTCEREALVESSVVDVVEARSNAPHTETHEGKPVKSIRTPSLEPEAAFTTVSGMCSETKDLFPGRTETSANGTMRWMPEKCKLPTVAELEGRKCMAGKNQVCFCFFLKPCNYPLVHIPWWGRVAARLLLNGCSGTGSRFSSFLT